MEITDAMLFEHAAEARDIWLSTLPSDDEIPEIRCSKKFERKMQKLIKEQRRTPRTNRILRYMKQTVAAVLAVAMISFGGLMTVEAYREKVIEIVIHVFNELTDYRFSSDNSTSGEVELPEVSFGYIPDGMKEVEDRVSSSDRRYILFEREDGAFFELTQWSVVADSNSGMILDTEDSEYKTGTINGYEAFFNEKNGYGTIHWMIDNTVYRLFGNIGVDELKTVAEKINIIQ